MTVGAFGSKLFEVSSNKIYTPDGISISEGLNIEMQEVEGNKPATYIKGYKEMNIGFEITLRSQFCNVTEEIDWWLSKMRSKKPEFLSIGNKTWGKYRFIVTNVSVSDTKILADGSYQKAKISLSFSEFRQAGYKKEDT